MSTSAPNCNDCRHFYVTYDPKAPRGCRLHGFKTDATPGKVVERESGIPCQVFAPKPERRSQNG